MDQEEEPTSTDPEENSVVQLEVPKKQVYVNISGGPLSYSYTFDSIHIHFGRDDKQGSEHFIDGVSFPAEVIAIISREHFNQQSCLTHELVPNTLENIILSS